MGYEYIYVQHVDSLHDSLPSLILTGLMPCDRFKYKEGILHYRFDISEEDPYNRKVHLFKTWPLIERPTYYIFIYIRFRLGGKDWSPVMRNGDKQYLIYRYKLERPDRDTKHNPRNFFEYEIKVDKIYVGKKPQPKLK